LEARSKFTCWNRSPAGFLHKLYKPGEKNVVFNAYESQGCEVWQHPGVTGNQASLNYLKKGSAGVWYLAQPVDGKFHWNPREKKESRRSEESVTDWRYFVIESDKAPCDLWLRALVQLQLRIAAIYDSGGKSIHALIRIDAESKAAWNEIVNVQMAAILVRLGVRAGRNKIKPAAERFVGKTNCPTKDVPEIRKLRKHGAALSPKIDMTSRKGLFR
jgi:hypothetical protein